MAERKRRLVSGELAEAALQLLAENGFDAVTIDEIAGAAGVSKRTFFRYFASKEDVVVQVLADLGPEMRAVLAARPGGERPSVALRHAVWVSLAACAARSNGAGRDGHSGHTGHTHRDGQSGRTGHTHRDDQSGHDGRALRVVQLILRTPALLGRFLERQVQWRDELAAELAHRHGLDPVTAMYPRLAAGMALAAFDTALRRWSESDGAEDPAVLLDEAFAVVAPALDTVGAPRA
ncbi:TetR family transcriptional regulator [Kitasatospora sp. NBC_00085]|uniref:TetR family transcriptional regulator n=1 Tax=unclassified Kitasatospora TaxID=2633591 RepID=UPI00324E0113